MNIKHFFLSLSSDYSFPVDKGPFEMRFLVNNNKNNDKRRGLSSSKNE